MTLETEPGNPADEAAPDQKKKSPAKALLLVMLIVIVAIGFVMARRAFGKAGKPHKEVDKVAATMTMEDFLINLTDSGGDHLLKTNIALGIDQRTTADKFKEKIPEARDAIVMVLSTKSLADIGTVDGKAKLKDEIKDRVNQEIGEKDVDEVYFQAFVTQ